MTCDQSDSAIGGTLCKTTVLVMYVFLFFYFILVAECCFIVVMNEGHWRSNLWHFLELWIFLKHKIFQGSPVMAPKFIRSFLWLQAWTPGFCLMTFIWEALKPPQWQQDWRPVTRWGWKMKPVWKCQKKIQFLEWPFEAGSKSADLMPTDKSKIKAWIYNMSLSLWYSTFAFFKTMLYFIHFNISASLQFTLQFKNASSMSSLVQLLDMTNDMVYTLVPPYNSVLTLNKHKNGHS